VSDRWSAHAEAYRTSEAHTSGADLELLAEWAVGETALDVASGGGHVARRLAEAGFAVVTVDPSPGMQADVLSTAEHLPFADGSFDVVVTRIATHHFADVQAAVSEMARVSRDSVLVVDNLYRGDQVEQAERLRDPTHVRNYSEDEWRGFFARAGLDVEDVQLLETTIDIDSWLERAGCEGADATRVRELLADLSDGGRLRMTRIALKGSKR
jgi:SAM-dependent methyltransferase